jgi:hypothetical protein
MEVGREEREEEPEKELAIRGDKRMGPATPEEGNDHTMYPSNVENVLPTLRSYVGPLVSNLSLAHLHQYLFNAPSSLRFVAGSRRTATRSGATPTRVPSWWLLAPLRFLPTIKQAIIQTVRYTVRF